MQKSALPTSPKFINLTGQRFGRYEVLCFVCIQNRAAMWRCKCDCGNEKIVNGSSLRRGKVKSCGCYKDENTGNRTRTHGLSKHPLHHIWRGMLRRCGDKNDAAYGGRGIYVSDEWKFDFQAFYNWAIDNGWKQGLQIDRENNNGPYSPSNCRVATRKQNCRNRRNSRYITVRGMTKTLAEFAEMVGEKSDIIHYRMRHGWTEEEAIFTPFRRRNKNA
jgi:hypothetical protein